MSLRSDDRDSAVYLGKSIGKLPTPALLLDRRVLQQNIDRLHQDVSKLGIAFRPHVKTLKSIEVTRMMLGEGRYRKIVASTLSEIETSLPLVREGLLDECLYGLPIYPGVLPRLCQLREQVAIVLMVDHEDHIDLLEKFDHANQSTTRKKWDIFIKIDVGSHRAGLQTGITRLKDLVNRAESSSAVEVYGFYCHAGHSYGCRSAEAVSGVLSAEINGVQTAAGLLSSKKPVILSVGATPTAHAIGTLKAALPSHCSLELHAGNFPANDLQQVSTGLVSLDQQAVRILAEVCSVYPERNEALVNAGVIAMSRETSAYPGFGVVADKQDWAVVRLSQEHGIIGLASNADSQAQKHGRVEESFAVGDKVQLYCQHACITAAAFPRYFVVDDRDSVVEIWEPCKFW